LCIGTVGIDRTDVTCLLLLETRPADACENNRCESGTCLIRLYNDEYHCQCFPGYEGDMCNSKYSSFISKRFHIFYYKDKTVPTLSIPPYLFVCVWWGCIFVCVRVCLYVRVCVCVCVCMLNVSMIFSVSMCVCFLRRNVRKQYATSGFNFNTNVCMPFYLASSSCSLYYQTLQGKHRTKSAYMCEYVSE